MRKQLGFVGLGKMGRLMVQTLRHKGWKVLGFDLREKGDVKNIQEMMERLAYPRVVWLMVPSGKPVDDVLKGMRKFLQRGDVIIDGGNSFYRDSQRRAKTLSHSGIAFLDAGVSGGLEGAKKGACVMVGGERRTFKKMEPLFRDLAAKDSFQYVGSSGAGHFVQQLRL